MYGTSPFRTRFLILMLVASIVGLGSCCGSVSWAAESTEIVSERFTDPDLLVIPPQEQAPGWKAPWKTSKILPAQLVPSLGATPSGRNDVLIQGTGDRNNPLRRQLLQNITDYEFYVGYRLIYEPPAEGVSAKVDPEFFVLWLDRVDGSDQAVHNSQIPNIGIHQADRGPSKGKNVFMVRFGASRTEWSHEVLEYGKEYRLVARLSKQKPGERNDYSQIQLWVNPGEDDAGEPLLTLSNQQGIHQIQWLGFATGRKTERSDRIRIGDVVLSRSWEGAVGFLNDAAGMQGTKPRDPELVWDQPIDFKHDIYPILQQRCFECHAGDFPDSGYRLDVRNELLGYSTGEPFVHVGSSRHSQLIESVTSKADNIRMPPEGEPLSKVEIAKISAWIDQGLDWDDELLPTPEVKTDHWAFQQIQRPEIPNVDSKSQIDHPIDSFILARQQQEGLQGNRPATKRTLIRRLYLDLLGLPPTLVEVESFVKDDSEDAYAHVVENVLASPHYGERMGRYWLDLARWGESQGFQHDIPRPFAWRYRDYVISSFNADKPYDQFLKEQLAGDELTEASNETLVATGFLAAARISGNQMDKTLQRSEVMFDIVNNTASALLGLTMECAQCHNHKFEPLSQRDYYRFYGFFAQGQLANLKLDAVAEISADQIKDWFAKESYDFYLREAKKLKIDPADYAPHTWGYYSPATGNPNVEVLPVVNRSPIPYSPDFLKHQQARIFVRGEPKNPGLPVEPGWPAVLGTIPSTLEPTPRQALADWMADEKNPLVARVWANRIWQQHFGRGIVSTPSDFGTHGALPSHPELLDWLASELISSRWSTKHLHRLIVTSKTYQQASQVIDQSLDQDPENVYLWRWPQRRLEAEAIRDSVLVATNELDRTIGGPSVPPQHSSKKLRRTIYLTQRRSKMPDVMTMFDAPDCIKSCSQRGVSTVALQPLYLLNSPFVVERAQKLASSIREAAAGDYSEQVRLLFLRTLGREPTDLELDRTLSLLTLADAKPGQGEDDPTQLQLVRLCHSMLNLNEFVYLP